MPTQKKAGHIGTISAVKRGNNWHTAGSWIRVVELSGLFVEWGLVVPRGVKRLWFTLHDKPGVNRAELQVRTWGGTHPVVEFDGTELFNRKGCDKILGEYIGKAVYLEVEYMEP